MPMIRPRRSLLFMPGANVRALEKARELPADGLIFDLEDAVAPDAKPAARDAVAAALAQGGYGRRELVLRVNALGTEWGLDDLRAAAHMPLDAVLLPKVESAERARETVAALDQAAAPAGLAIWAMIETPRGVLAAAEIAAAPRVAALVMGTSDLTKDLGALTLADRLPLLTSPRTEAITDPPAASCYPACYRLFFDTEIEEFQQVDPDLFFFSRARARGQHAEGPSPALRSRTAMAISA